MATTPLPEGELFIPGYSLVKVKPNLRTAKVAKQAKKIIKLCVLSGLILQNWTI
jgi:hypothetical protein